LGFHKYFEYSKINKLNSLASSIPLSICDEKNLVIDEEIIKNMEVVMSSKDIGDSQEIKSIISYIENKFKPEDFKDTREILKEEFRNFFENIITNKELDSINK